MVAVALIGVLTATSALADTEHDRAIVSPSGGFSPTVQTRAAEPREVREFLDEVVPEQLDEHQIPGAAVVVVAEGRQIDARGYGVSDISRETPVNPARTGFFVGSVAKMFTATAVQQLVEQGDLDMDADVNSYLGEFKIRDTYPGAPVTVGDLLTHTGGFDNAIMGAAARDASDVGSLGNYVAEHQPARVRPPGEYVSYDNYGVALAGHLVEVVSGVPFADYVDARIFQPLGMSGATLAQPQPEALQATAAVGYRPDGAGQSRTYGQFGPMTPTGAGAMATATDMGRFMLAHLPDPENPILEASSVTQMQTHQAGLDPRLPGMGHLWERRTRNGRPLITKDGDVPGFHANLALLPEQRAGIYVAYNGDGKDGEAFFAAKELVDEFVDQFYPGTPQPREPMTEAPSDQFAGSFRSIRTSHSELTAASALVGGISVEAHSDGSLTTHGTLSPDPDKTSQEWTQIAPGLFQEKDGQDMLAFSEDGASMATSADPAATYEQLDWYQQPILHQAVMGAGLLLLLLGLLGWPIAALVGRLRSQPPHARGARTARLICAATGVVLIAYTTAFFMLTADGNALNETLFLGESPLLIVVRTLSILAILATAATVVSTALAWRSRWWNVVNRVHYTASAAGAVGFLVVASSYNLVGSSLW